MKKVKNTIPVFDICSLKSNNHAKGDVIAEPFGNYLLAHPNLHVPHRHSFYHIVLFTEGGGSHSIDFELFDVAPGQIYFMKPGQVHSWAFQGHTDGYVINFSDHLFDSFLVNAQYPELFPFLQGVAKDCVLNLEPGAYAAVKIIIEHIVQEVHNPGVHNHDLIRTYLVELFIIASRTVAEHSAAGTKPQNQLLLHNFRKLVDIHYAEMRLPKDYAALLYITPNHLNALCKDLLGRPAGEIIRDRILLEAKRLLINADVNISEIAISLDFTDNSHFTRFFKKHTNQTPEEFRRTSSDKA